MKVSILVSLVAAWGPDGHRLIGDIAQAFLTTESIQALTHMYPQNKLRDLCTWADSIKSKPAEYGWANSYHFVNPKDDAPRKCEYVDERDCPDGKCIVGAIANYTTQAKCGQPQPVRDEAIKFLAHFIGDIAQPLHACGRARGGNDVEVKFDGKPKKLHAIWDSDILLKRVKNDFKGDIGKYQRFLVEAIQNGAYQSIASEWLTKHDVFATSNFGNSLAAIEWTNDSNGLNCNSVWNAFDRNPNQDFGKQYYLDNYRMIDLQLAKAGYRLANHLNKICKSCL